MPNTTNPTGSDLWPELPTPEPQVDELRELEGLAMSIVFQIGDELYDALPRDIAHNNFVDARQATNDRLIDFTRDLITTKRAEWERESYLRHFSYDDWELGDDNKLRVGDYIFCDHQDPATGAEETFEGQIVEHYDNKLPVIIYNVERDNPDDSGEYADLQNLYMYGWTFSRIKALKEGK